MGNQLASIRIGRVVWRAACCLMLCIVSSARAQHVGDVGEDGTVWKSSNGETRSVVYNAIASGVPVINVAIIASASANVTDPFFTDPQNRLIASGNFVSVTVINAGATTPTAMDLQAFDAVLVWSNFSFADPVALGDRLADYVDDGGGVVIAVFANSTATLGKSLSGRWKTANYDVVPVAGGTTSGSVATLGTIQDPAHPIMAGVTSFDGGSSSFRPTDTSLIPSGTLIARWSDGSTLVAVREDTVGARADLGFYPPSNTVLAGLWDPTTDGGTLLSNALLYAAQRTPLNLGDADNDGDVDIDDYNVFDGCVNADPNVFAPAGCIVFDFDGDKNVDCADWLALRAVWAQPSPIPFPLACSGELPAASSWGLAVFALGVMALGTIGLRRRARII